MKGLIEGWARDQKRRGLLPSTIQRRCSQARSWQRWCDDQGLTFATALEEDVEQFIDAKRVGAKTRYTWISSLGCFYRWAIRAGHLDHDPTAEIIRPKLRRTMPRPIPDDDLALALALAPAQMRCWLILAAYAGLRCAEIAGLCRDDVLHDQGVLRVVGKGQKERLVPMSKVVRATLDDWPSPRQNRPIFQRPAGGAWPPALLSRKGSEYLHSIGVDATMHQLRHWFATRTYRASKDLRVVQELLGHSTPSVTAIYTAFDQDDARAAVEALTGPLSAVQQAAAG